MKAIAFSVMMVLALSCAPADRADRRPGGNPSGRPLPAWFKDGKFGMFIHWGPYSVLGGEWKGRRIEQGDIAEWIMERFRIPVEEYRKIAATFNPTGFDAREWVSLAKRTGMKYIVITAKHHDGFAMFRSAASRYNIVDFTPFGRDPIRELAEACAEAGLKFCVYYSHREDWDHPYAYGNVWDYATSQTQLDTMDHPDLFRRYLDEKAIPQLKELLTNYGPLGIVWFDRGMYTQEQGREFADLVHALQPGCLVNGRVGHYDQELLGDYQSLTDNGMPQGGIEEAWETPQTLNDTWGYSRLDQNWKSPAMILRRLVSVVSKGGNYLLNVGPTGEGVIPRPSVDILDKVGAWIGRNGESVYGTSPSPFPTELEWGFATRKGTSLYLHVFDWPEDGRLLLTGLRNRVTQAHFLAEKGRPLSFERDGSDRISIALPEKPVDPIDSVVVLEIDGEPDVDPWVISQEPEKPIVLGYLTAATRGRAVKRFNRRGETEQFHISKMTGPDDVVQWNVRVVTPGPYDVSITYAAIPGWEDGGYVVESGGSRIRGTVKSSPGWYEYKTEKIGRLEIARAGETVFRIRPEKRLDHSLMYLQSVELVPVRSPRP